MFVSQRAAPFVTRRVDVKKKNDMYRTFFTDRDRNNMTLMQKSCRGRNRANVTFSLPVHRITKFRLRRHLLCVGDGEISYRIHVLRVTSRRNTLRVRHRNVNGVRGRKSRFCLVAVRFNEVRSSRRRHSVASPSTLCPRYVLLIEINVSSR